MIGTLENGHYRPFIARGAAEEERMFRDFLAFVGDPSKAHLYQWTKFEIRTLESAARRHPSLAGPLGELAAACVDLHEITKAAVVLPLPSYSLKQVAPKFADFQWRQGKEVDGHESMVLYWEWLDDGALEPIEKVLVYNEDDVRALEAVDRRLQQPLSG
jgi:predicted RecB family nuclease